MKGQSQNKEEIPIYSKKDSQSNHKECQTPARHKDSSIKPNSTAEQTEKAPEPSGRKSSTKDENESRKSTALSNAQKRIQQEVRVANDQVLNDLIRQKEQSDKKLAKVMYLTEGDRTKVIKESQKIAKAIDSTQNHIFHSSQSPLCPEHISKEINFAKILEEEKGKSKTVEDCMNEEKQKLSKQAIDKQLTNKLLQTPSKPDGRPPTTNHTPAQKRDQPITENKQPTGQKAGQGKNWLPKDNKLTTQELIPNDNQTDGRVFTENSELFDIDEQNKEEFADVLSAYVLEFTNQQMANVIEDTLRGSELRDNILLGPNSETGKWINYFAMHKCQKLRRNTAMMVNYERDLNIYGYQISLIQQKFDYDAAITKARAWVESLISTVTSWDRNDTHKAEIMMVNTDYNAIYEQLRNVDKMGTIKNMIRKTNKLKSDMNHNRTASKREGY